MIFKRGSLIEKLNFHQVINTLWLTQFPSIIRWFKIMAMLKFYNWMRNNLIQF
jgi:hypothetical protein